MKLRPFSTWRQENKELLVFLAIAFALPFLWFLVPAIFSLTGNSLHSLSSFSLFNVLCPAAGAMVVSLVYRAEDPLLPRTFFRRFLGLTAIVGLWALWHLPSSLSFDHDSLTQIGPSFLLSCLNCIAFGTFLAFIYLKTHNIWLAILIHFCNNNLPLMLPQADTWIQATASTLIQLAIFLPFLFSNVFRRAPSP